MGERASAQVSHVDSRGRDGCERLGKLYFTDKSQRAPFAGGPKLLKSMVRPERFELPTFWFVASFGGIGQDRSEVVTACKINERPMTAAHSDRA
jgi:hypothetical protein